jgi:hypothetical protein
LFGSRWKTALATVCLLPIVVLVVLWALIPSEPSIYSDSVSGAAELDRGILEVGSVPPDNPSNTSVTASTEAYGHSDMSQANLRRTESGPRNGNEKEHRTNQHSNEEAGLTRGRGSEDTSGILITGQMTLHDIEGKTGISARVLADRLGLPRSASLDDRLGRLRKRYRFTMQDVRDIIASSLERRNTL